MGQVEGGHEFDPATSSPERGIACGRLTIQTTLPNFFAAEQLLARGDVEAFHIFLTDQSRIYEPSYLAFEAVRKGGRAQEVVGTLPALPFTGMEGHFYGIPVPSDEIVRHEAIIGKAVLDSLVISRRLHRTTLSDLENTLRGDRLDVASALELDSILGATVARVKALHSYLMEKYHGNQKKNTAFRELTYTLVRRVPRMMYELRPQLGTVAQTYEIPKWTSSKNGNGAVYLTPEEQEGYEALANIGRFAHPLFRTLTSSGIARRMLERKRKITFY